MAILPPVATLFGERVVGQGRGTGRRWVIDEDGFGFIVNVGGLVAMAPRGFGLEPGNRVVL